MVAIDSKKRIKIAMIELGLVQQDLANKIGMSRTVLNMIVNNRINPSFEEKEAIASALHKKVDELFGD